MRIVSFILTVMIMFLIAQPVVSMVVFQENDEYSCCDSMCSPLENKNDKKENRDCTGKNCNPFQVCNSCVFVLDHSTNSFEESAKLEISEVQKFDYQSVFISQFIPDFWQPPKIA